MKYHLSITEHPFEGLEMTLAALLNFAKLAPWDVEKS